MLKLCQIEQKHLGRIGCNNTIIYGRIPVMEVLTRRSFRSGIETPPDLPKQFYLLRYILQGLVIREREEFMKLRRAQIPTPKDRGDQLFRWYEASDRFEQLKRERMNYNGQSERELEGKGRHDFAGEVFEDIARDAFGLQQQGRRIFISQQKEMLDFWKNLYPNARVIHKPLEKDTLLGVSVPDGLIVNQSIVNQPIWSELSIVSIVGIVECTLSEKVEVFLEKHNSFISKQKNFPSLFGRANLVFVIPETSSGSLNDIKNNIGDSSVRFVQMPFDRTRFRFFINYHLSRLESSRDRRAVSLVS